MIPLQDLLNQYSNGLSCDPSIFWLVLGIDYHFIDKGGLDAIVEFENREPGCVSAMCKGFLKLLDNVHCEQKRLRILDATTENEQRSTAFRIKSRLKKYHELCTTNVAIPHSRNAKEYKKIVPGKYRDISIGYGFKIKDTARELRNGTRDGHAYLSARPHIRGPITNGMYTIIPKYYRLSEHIEEERVNDIVCLSIHTYDISLIVYKLTLRLIQDLQRAQNTATQKLHLAEYIQDMMTLHPFKDGNNRALVGLLLNEILLDIGQTPVVFMQPNVFDGFTPDELIDEITEAQYFFQDICSGDIPVPPSIKRFSRHLFHIAIKSDDQRLIDMVIANANVSAPVQQILLTMIPKYKENIELGKDAYPNTYRNDFIQALITASFANPNAFIEHADAILSLFWSYENSACFIFAAFKHAKQFNYVELEPWCITQLRNYPVQYTPDLLLTALHTENPVFIAHALNLRNGPFTQDMARAAHAFFVENNVALTQDLNDHTSILLTSVFLLSLIDPYKNGRQEDVLTISAYIDALLPLLKPDELKFLHILYILQQLQDYFPDVWRIRSFMKFIKTLDLNSLFQIINANIVVFSQFLNQLIRKKGLILGLSKHISQDARLDTIPLEVKNKFLTNMYNLFEEHVHNHNPADLYQDLSKVLSGQPHAQKEPSQILSGKPHAQKEPSQIVVNNTPIKKPSYLRLSSP